MRSLARYAQRWSAAEAALVLAWAAMGIGLLSYGWRHGNLGVVALALFAVWQMTHVWRTVHH